MGFATEFFGFPSGGAYVKQLKRAPLTWVERVFKVRTFQEQEDDRHEVGEMKRCLGAFDLICIGVGLMLGAGVFVTTGAVAANDAGPAVIISYLVAGFSACLSSLCYAEFSANMPLSGGAYSYISAVFGEFLAWITVANLILEYILANAAVIRGFSPYFAMLINKAPESLVTATANYTLDWFAFGWCLLLTVMLVLGTKESAMFNLVVTIVHIILVVFIIIAGLVKSKPSVNLQPFTPFGVRGIFNGAAIVFFSYIGFDAVATSAEEVKNPKRDLPLGILGALCVVTICYILMSLALVSMVPISALQEAGSFAAAFQYVGMDWARYIVALGAVLGIITGTLVGMFAVSRIIAAVARQHLLPPFLAKVHKRFGTPYISTALSGVATAVIALFTSFDELLNMVSISTLFAFWIVALALMWKRYYTPGSNGKNALMAGQLLLLVGAALTFTIVYWVMPDSYIGMIVAAAVFVLMAFTLFFTGRQGHRPSSYSVPLFPFVPALSVGLNTFLLGQLDRDAYIRFGIWTVAVTGVYMLYGSLASAQHDKKADRALPTNGSTLNDVPSLPYSAAAEEKGLVAHSKAMETAADATAAKP
ncbi:hypothetical protein OEZ85_000131 [Tetradesmus obliquus]|uniref:Cationic amino acid transporter C-terminal domain-containing protein n=1 Tax=Tetradesmus obliquus TaxID=3088 RepID=A0ABY8UP81_TETOB|nr:hypothetical protein OEZ85_000131 [Tetradesmus obliquus]